MAEPENETYTAAHVHDAIALDPRVAELGIDVSVDGERITIRGVVPTEERRLAAAAIAAELHPTHEIRNLVTVRDVEEAGEPEVIG
jgi:osmotically-inducible protein OsmY